MTSRAAPTEAPAASLSPSPAGGEAALQGRMREVEAAICSLKARQGQGLALASLDLPPPRSHLLIDTQPRRSACPVCFADVAESALRRHLAESCAGSEAACPHAGCGLRMPAGELRHHMQQTCVVAKRRRMLAKKVKAREVGKRLAGAQAAEAALLRRRAEAKEARLLRQRRWPPPDDSNSSGGGGGGEEGDKPPTPSGGEGEGAEGGGAGDQAEPAPAAITVSSCSCTHSIYNII
jgi:hypothetical protein